MVDLAETKTKPAPKTAAKNNSSRRGQPNLNHRTYFLNRELSWLKFNERVLEEALNPNNPLLERVKFLSIFGSNLDEFFMIRVSGLRRQHKMGVVKAPPDGLTPGEQLAQIHESLLPPLRAAGKLWKHTLYPSLEEEGICILSYEQLKKKQIRILRDHFKRDIFPILTPMAVDTGHPFPHISNLSINLAVLIETENGGQRFARIKVPHALTRLLRVPTEEKASTLEKLGLHDLRGGTLFVWLEDVIAANLDLLFPGHKIVGAWGFRVTRDADVEIEEDEASDLISAMEEVVGQRFFGSSVRLEVERDMPKETRDLLTEHLKVAPYQVYASKCPLSLSDLMQLYKVDAPHLKDPSLVQRTPKFLSGDEDIFGLLKKRDVLLYHPYDSFLPVENFIRQAARDPQVIAIKQTLYRTGPNSPVVGALMEARNAGKQVAALVELKARFDEENNIVWARALEKAGVHVVYGLMGLKTHAKMCLVVRREDDGVRKYCHLGTGNYNPVTARIYTDLGLFTSNNEITSDISELFNSITGYSQQSDFRKIIAAPHNMRSEIIRRIDREIEHHKKTGKGHIFFKMNSLVDKDCVKALYRASQAGVKVELNIRGICVLRPGIPRVSENITVTSIVGRFLEHARIYYFHNGGEEEIFCGSADLMPRNLDRRIEVLFPIEDRHIFKALRDDILFVQSQDNVQARRLDRKGNYQSISFDDPAKALDTQNALTESKSSWWLD